MAGELGVKSSLKVGTGKPDFQAYFALYPTLLHVLL